MLFNSFAYAIFFPTVVGIYFALPHRFRWALLLAASCLFYLAFIPAFILILAFTIAVDFVSGLLIERTVGRTRRLCLAGSIIANISVLATFKYFNFASSNLTAMLHGLGSPTTLPLLHMILPIGLSFHTFQSMSYTIEVYRGKVPAERHLGIFALYVMFFPQLVAGPIERPQNLLEQFRTPVSFDYPRLLSGLRLILWGLLKKVVIADSLGPAVDHAFRDPKSCSASALILATYFFAIQIYCDFSGYSDIAIGSARVLGIKLMLNFDRPYGAQSIPEFWRRWHISLSTWFRDYVYVPLGGNRRHRRRNLVIVFLLSGLWHGANWTFLIWGALHASFMLAADFVSPKRTHSPTSRAPLRRFISVAATFHAVAFAWIFFRASSFHDALSFIGRIGHSPFVVHNPLAELGMPSFQRAIAGVALVILLLNEWASSPQKLFDWFDNHARGVQWCLYYVAILAVLFASGGAPRQFIYFQF